MGSVYNDAINQINDSNIIWDNGQCYFMMAWFRMLHVTSNCWVLTFISARSFFQRIIHMCLNVIYWLKQNVFRYCKPSLIHDWLVTKWFVATNFHIIKSMFIINTFIHLIDWFVVVNNHNCEVSVNLITLYLPH